MSEFWFIADCHFGHGNIIKFCRRTEFMSEEEVGWLDTRKDKWWVSQDTIDRHDQAILDNINSVVHPQDQLFVIGDFCMDGYERARHYRNRIRCRNVTLVRGNHDRRGVERAFNRVMDQGLIEANGQVIFLNHYPMRSWDRSFYGAWSLYGHVHDRLTWEDKAKPWTLTKDVGVDADPKYKPESLTDLRAYMAPRMELFFERKKRLLEGDSAAADVT
jgi:calcineurin-like phosphoesterase family protein